MSTEISLGGLAALGVTLLLGAIFWPCWERSGLRRDIHRASTRIRRRKPAPPSHPGHRRAPRIQLTEPEVFAAFADIVAADRAAAARIPRQQTSNEGDDQ